VNGKRIELVVDGMREDEIYNTLLSHTDEVPVAAKEESLQ
jgi:hypothetical protein